MTANDSGSAPDLVDDGLPTFARPPVNETALSIQFSPIPGLAPYLGLYWAQIRAEFESSQVLAPLPTVMEQFDKPLSRSKLGLQFVSDPPIRFWFLRDGGTQLVQIQNDRFVYNWRQVTGDEMYPRYPVVRDGLRQEWERFCSFLRTEHFDPPEVNQCEVTYVNHLEYDTGWAGFGELSRVIEPWGGEYSGKFLPKPEHVSIESHYRLPEDQGRLHIAVEPVVRGRDSKEVLQLTLTARGAPRSSTTEDVLGWMDIGRRWVVKGFIDFTTPSMHQKWGLYDRDHK